MLASRMGMKRTVVSDQRRVLGDGWEIQCISRSPSDSESVIGLLLALWPAILIDNWDCNPQQLELGSETCAFGDIELAPTQSATEVLPSDIAKNVDQE